MNHTPLQDVDNFHRQNSPLLWVGRTPASLQGNRAPYHHGWKTEWVSHVQFAYRCALSSFSPETGCSFVTIVYFAIPPVPRSPRSIAYFLLFIVLFGPTFHFISTRIGNRHSIVFWLYYYWGNCTYSGNAPVCLWTNTMQRRIAFS